MVARAGYLRKDVGMFKSVGILAGGIFIGAVGAEIVRRACPSCGLNGIWAKAGDFARASGEAFMDGYRDTVGSEKSEVSEA